MPTVQIVGAASSIINWPVIDGAERWVFNASYLLDQGRPYTRVFELHDSEITKAVIPQAWAWCQTQDHPVYLLAPHPDLPNARIFPLWELAQHFAYDGHAEWCFGCTVDYLIALALYEGFTHIELAGIEVRDSVEYQEQRASLSYWIGRARGLGVKVVCSKTSSLGTVPALYGYNTVTGFPAPPDWEQPVRGHKYSMMPSPQPALINGAFEHP